MIAYWHHSGLHDNIILADTFDSKQDAAKGLSNIHIQYIASYRLIPIRKEATISRGL